MELSKIHTLAKHSLYTLLAAMLFSCGGGDQTPPKANDNNRTSSSTGSFTKLASVISAEIEVDAGISQVSDPNLLVPLNGSARTFLDGSLQFQWTQISGPSAFILNPFQANTSVLVPDISQPTVLNFRLSATLLKTGDDNGLTNSSTMSIIVNPFDAAVRAIGGAVNESSDQADFSVTLAQPAQAPTLFEYFTEDQTARAGTDYEAVSGTLTFAVGEQEKTLMVPLLNDTFADGDKHFLLRLEPINTDTAAVRAFAAIIDDESPGQRQISAPAQEVDADTRALPELSGQSGIVRANLSWAEDRNDIDIIVTDPCGNEISFGARIQTCQGLTGQLEADNSDSGVVLAAENIFWGEDAPRGEYIVSVLHFAGEATAYQLNVFWGEESALLEGRLTNGERLEVFRFVFGDQNDASPTPTIVPTPIITPSPDGFFSPEPTPTPSRAPTATPTPEPGFSSPPLPGPTPSSTPTNVPTAAPTSVPTVEPTTVPTAAPTSVPTAAPTPGVVDTTPPELTLVGPSTITLAQGQTYIEPGATAFDDQNGEVTNIEISGAVDEQTPGEYIVTYRASDLAGNRRRADRTVIIEPRIPFITTWKTDNAGPFGDDQIFIRARTGQFEYNYTINWGDGNQDTNVIGSISHTYAEPGTYTISITGLFPQLDFSENISTINEKFLSIEQWGDNPWLSMSGAFRNTGDWQLNAQDTPDLSQVNDMSLMFSRSRFNQDINQWNVSNVINMQDMFFKASSFNQSLNNWDVSNVTNMEGMFFDAHSFNQSLDNWDVANVVNMRLMFHQASSFNQNIGNWNTGAVTNMNNMFEAAFSFNQDIGDWNLINVINMAEMFRDAIAFDQDIGRWNVSNVNTMSGMFASARAFNQDIGNWNVSSVTNMKSMFDSASIFNGDITRWDVSNVIDMSRMFRNTSAFNQPIGNWDVSSVDYMGSMFINARAFNQDIGSWNVSGVFDMTDMFSAAENFNQDISSWDVSNVTNMNGMFRSAQLSTENYDALLNGWASLPSLQENVNFDGGLSAFSGEGLDARNALISTYGWIITDGGIAQDPTPSPIPTSIPIPDNEAPIIQLIGDSELILAQGQTYIEPGATAFDETDGEITDIEIIGSADGQTPGEYTITYSARDLEGNTAEITRTVIVEERIPFITTWKTDNAGTSEDNQIFLRTAFNEFTYDYTIDWGDGNIDSNVVGDITHTYAIPGTYTISITGLFPQLRFFIRQSDPQKLVSIEQWGNNLWLSMNRAFQGVGNIEINALDTPNFSQVTDMSLMFSRSQFNQDINNWDVSNVTNMAEMFLFAGSFNQNLDNWDVANVVNMGSMFQQAGSFNQNIGNWNTGAVTNMNSMFEAATSFNQDIGDWNLINVTDMTEMFRNAIAFDQDIGRWNVSNVNTMRSMFVNARIFNQNLNAWDVSSVSDMSGMFADTAAFNQNIDGWNASSVTNMSSMFLNATAFNQSINNWQLGSVISMNNMFRGATRFNQDLNRWNVSSVTDMSHMFSGALNFNRSIGSWDVSSVSNMNNMFFNAGSFDQEIGQWNVSNVINMRDMFFNAESFNQDISGWDVGNVTDMRGMFLLADSFNQDIGSWNVSAVKTMGSMLSDATSFNQDISNWDVSSVTDMSFMFNNTRFNQDISSWNVASVTNMRAMFANTVAFNQEIGDWNVSSSTDMREMFLGATAFNQDISSWDVRNVTLMSFMFEGATIFNQNIGSWDVSSVTTMDSMFQGASAFNQDISGWDISSVRDLEEMFFEAIAFDQDISDWDTRSVGDMEGMFAGAISFNQAIGTWDTGNTSNMLRMFAGATNFDQNLSGWDVSRVTRMSNMFTDTRLSTENYDALLTGWSSLPSLQQNVTFDGGNSQFTEAGAEARDSLINTYGWRISDGGEAGGQAAGAF